MPGQSFTGFQYASGSKYARVRYMAKLVNMQGFQKAFNMPE